MRTTVYWLLKTDGCLIEKAANSGLIIYPVILFTLSLVMDRSHLRTSVPLFWKISMFTKVKNVWNVSVQPAQIYNIFTLLCIKTNLIETNLVFLNHFSISCIGQWLVRGAHFVFQCFVNFLNVIFVSTYKQLLNNLAVNL